MDGKKSRFESMSFDNGLWYAANSAKYTAAEAVDRCRNDTGFDPVQPVQKAEVYYGYGLTEDWEHVNAWWLNLNGGAGESPRRCPVWAMEVSDVEVCS